MNTTFREIITSQLEGIVPPPGDMAAVACEGGRMRARKRLKLLSAGSASLVLVGLLITQIAGEAPAPRDSSSAAPRASDDSPSGSGQYPVLASFDITKGLRAWATPDVDGTIHLGDRSYPTKGLRYLDTDASATPYGMVFFDKDQKPRLLSSSGRVEDLGEGPPAPTKGFRVSSKWDATRPWATWTENHQTFVRIVLFDFSTRSSIAHYDFPCTGKTCNSVKVEGLDEGLVFVKTAAATYVWNQKLGSFDEFGGPDLRVADVHSRTVLYAGSAPTHQLDGWRYVSGKIDAQLTFDGKHVLYWANKLASTTPGGTTITLDQGGDSHSWFTFDTDGSVLVATTESRSNSGLEADVFDCEVPSGQCTKLGDLKTDSGDPLFIGEEP